MQVLVPAITELAQLDRAGREQLKVSRIGLNSIASNLDRSAEPAFTEALKNKVYFSPVYFRKESEPYLTIAVAHASDQDHTYRLSRCRQSRRKGHSEEPRQSRGQCNRYGGQR